MLIHLQAETRSCYSEAEQRPLTGKRNGGTVYTVNRSILAWAKAASQNVVVVITSGVYTYVSKTKSKLDSVIFEILANYLCANVANLQQ